MSARRTVLLAVVAVLLISTAYAGDPPARVARLNYISGQISIQPNGVDEWVAANINRPLTSSDRVWADKDSRAELQLGGAAMRLNSETSLTLVNVADNNVQVQLDQGTLNLHVVELFGGEIYEIDTPNLAFTIRKAGDYRLDVDNAGDTTIVTTFRGEGDATGDGPAVRVRKNQQFTFRDGKSLLFARTEPGRDGFDDWCRVRADREDRAISARYVSRYTVGYSDLDDYGYWETVPTYGAIWYPRSVVVGWAPYHYGHWVYIAPWGWTWVDDAPWGFAPFHYGRWVYYGSRWGWCPGPRYVRPYYAPALVAWVGGPHFGVGVSFGGGVGWFPLGWGEPYIPYYRHSRGYFEHVNVSNTRITNITYITNNYYDHHRDITNIHYANRERPGAVTAVSNDVFRGSRPTRDGFVKFSQDDIRRASIEREVHVNPTTNSVLGVNAGERRAAPPERFNRPGRGMPQDRPNAVTSNEPGRPAIPDHERRPEVKTSVTPASETVRVTRDVPRPPDRNMRTDSAEGSRPGRDVRNGQQTIADEIKPGRVPRPPDSLKTENPHQNQGPRVDNNLPRNNGQPHNDPVISTPTRPERNVPRPPEGQTPRSERIDKIDRVDNVDRGNQSGSSRPDRVDRNIARPNEGQVMRPERTDRSEREMRPSTPPVREERPVTRAPEVSRPTVTHQEAPRESRPSVAPSPPPRQSAPQHESKPDSRPSRGNNKAEQKNGGPQAGLRSFPSPYNSYASTSSVRPASYVSTPQSYSSYRSTPSYRQSSVRPSYSARSYSGYSNRSYSGASGYRSMSQSTRYSQASSHSSARSYSASRGSASSGSHRGR